MKSKNLTLHKNQNIFKNERLEKNMKKRLIILILTGLFGGQIDAMEGTQEKQLKNSKKENCDFEINLKLIDLSSEAKKPLVDTKKPIKTHKIFGIRGKFNEFAVRGDGNCSINPLYWELMQKDTTIPKDLNRIDVRKFIMKNDDICNSIYKMYDELKDVLGVDLCLISLAIPIDTGVFKSDEKIKEEIKKQLLDPDTLLNVMLLPLIYESWGYKVTVFKKEEDKILYLPLNFVEPQPSVYPTGDKNIWLLHEEIHTTLLRPKK